MKNRIPLCAAAMLAAAAASAANPPAWNWRGEASSVALCNGTAVVWRLVYDAAQPKSYIHPLATVDGTVLTALRPPDHVWHRGLWFSWKFINGVNYWEEDKTTGRSAGLTELTGARVQTNADYSARAELSFSYHPPEKPAVMTEQRTLVVSAPDAAGCYTVDWTAEFTVGAEPVQLDRTPPYSKGGMKWGGYAGLSLRFPSGIKGWTFRTSEGKTGAAEANGEKARWVDFSGPVAGITVFNHPANPRHPSLWYLNESLPYFSPAVLYDAPMELKPGATMTLRYRVLVHPAPMALEAVAAFGISR